MNYNDGRTSAVLFDIKKERTRQLEKFGPQTRTFEDFHNEDSTNAQNLAMLRAIYDMQTRSVNGPDWDTILMEEIYEARTASTVDELRTELVQSAAVIVAMIEQIDRGEYKK